MLVENGFGSHGLAIVLSSGLTILLAAQESISQPPHIGLGQPQSSSADTSVEYTTDFSFTHKGWGYSGEVTFDKGFFEIHNFDSIINNKKWLSENNTIDGGLLKCGPGALLLGRDGYGYQTITIRMKFPASATKGEWFARWGWEGGWWWGPHYVSWYYNKQGLFAEARSGRAVAVDKGDVVGGSNSKKIDGFDVTEFHEYKIAMSEDSQQWYIDGKLVWQQNRPPQSVYHPMARTKDVAGIIDFIKIGSGDGPEKAKEAVISSGGQIYLKRARFSRGTLESRMQISSGGKARWGFADITEFFLLKREYADFDKVILDFNIGWEIDEGTLYTIFPDGEKKRLDGKFDGEHTYSVKVAAEALCWMVDGKEVATCEYKNAKPLYVAFESDDAQITLRSISIREQIEPKKNARKITDGVPDIKVSAGRAVLSNAYLSYDFSCPINGQLQLNMIQNKYLSGPNSNCLKRSRAPRLFVLSFADKQIDALSPELKIKDIELIRHNKEAGIVFILESKKPAMEIKLKIILDETPQSLWSMEIKNLGKTPLKYQPCMPVLGGIVVGETVYDNHYILPQKGGLITSMPVEMGATYGRYVMQAYDIFSPSAGGGIGGWVKDNSGLVKNFYVKKVEDPNVKFYKTSLSQTEEDPTRMRQIKGEVDRGCLKYPHHLKVERMSHPIFNFEKGCGFGVQYPWETLKPKATSVLPEAVIMVHSGDQDALLKAYHNWVASWNKDLASPSWTKYIYKQVCKYPEIYHADYSEKGTYIVDAGKNDHLHLYSRWTNWSRYDAMDRKIDDWNQRGAGMFIFRDRQGYHDNFDPEGNIDPNWGPNWGGIKTFRKFIADTQSLGIKTELYLGWVGGVSVAKGNSWLGRQHGGPDVPAEDDWAMMDKPGHYKQWYGKDEWWNFCVGVPAWQDMFAEMMKRIVVDTNVDAIYLDVLGVGVPDNFVCYNPSHHHESPYLQIRPMGGFLKKIKDKLAEGCKEIGRREKTTLLSEGASSTYLMQYFDWAYSSGLMNEAIDSPYHLTFLPINLLRFYFPEFKQIELPIHETNMTSFDVYTFNAAGSHSFFKEKLINDIYDMRFGIMRENGDALESNNLVPLVSGTNKVGVNKFIGENKTIYALYNPLPFVAKGELINVKTRPGFHYVDLFNHQSIRQRCSGDKVYLSIAIGPGDVTYVAELPTALKTERNADIVKVSFPESLKKPALRILALRDGAVVSDNRLTLRGNEAEFNIRDLQKRTGARIFVLKLLNTTKVDADTHVDFLIDERVLKNTD